MIELGELRSIVGKIDLIIEEFLGCGLVKLEELIVF